MRTELVRSFLAGALLAAFAAQGQETNCAGCHGAQGEGNRQVGAPPIAGQPESYLARQLEAYASGERRHPVMEGIAKSLTPEQRASFAASYSRLVPPPSKRTAAPATSPRARTLATKGDESRQVQACENCHGPGGTGQNDINPHLAGLGPAYLESALRAWRDGTRRTDPSRQMNLIAKNLSDADIKALSAYYGNQPLPQSGTGSPARQ